MTMKKILLILISAVVAFPLAAGIRSTEEFLAFAQTVASYDSIERFLDPDGTLRLETDLDLGNQKNFTSIKVLAVPFDAQGHRIKKWNSQGPLFEIVEADGRICNLVIDASCKLKCRPKADRDDPIGVIVSLNRGILEDCVNEAIVTIKSDNRSAALFVGGLVGTNAGQMYRCTNRGAITVEAGTNMEKVEFSIGGIAGRGSKSGKSYATFAWCVNEGNIQFNGCAHCDNVAGIVGSSNRATVKYCINRGAVSSYTRAITPTQSRTAGIAGYVKADILCCDNFADITSAGTSGPSTAGIAAAVNEAVVIGDCCNKGKILTRNEAGGCQGGICAGVTRAARIQSCINRGVVSFEGYSSKSRFSTGGIIGQITTPKDATAGAHVRNCANYAAIRSVKGGNDYANDNKAIHTGGVVGMMGGREKAPTLLMDCLNEGDISAEGGRKGSIAGHFSVYCKRGGQYRDTYAESASPQSDGTNVFGRITDEAGEALAGVTVSDGFQCVQTDAFGFYGMRSDLKKAAFVYISLPAECEVPTDRCLPQLYRRIARGEEAVMANFALARRAAANDSYTLLMVADPQIKPYGVDGSAEAWRDVVAPDIAQFRQTLDGECYCIDLGDLVYNLPVAFDDFLDVNAGVGCSTFNVIGNHDFDQSNLHYAELGLPYFRMFVGPENYSFNLGKMHFIALNDILYDRPNKDTKYGLGLSDETLEWLRQDLQFVPETTPLVLCTHAQLLKAKKQDATKNRHYADYISLLSRYAKVYNWSGHYHYNFAYDFAGKEAGMDQFNAICVSRATGALRLNRYWLSAGTPQGYIVVHVDGNTMTWSFKGVGKGVGEQMSVYAPSARTQGMVEATVWNWNPDWKCIEWWEDGRKVGDMEHFQGKDRNYVQQIADVTDEAHLLKYAGKGDSDLMFRIRPSEGAHSGDIRVVDPLGQVFFQHVEW